jgi:hypothetical protein
MVIAFPWPQPFCLNKCRPEWFAEWMREHPDFQLTKGYAPNPEYIPTENSGKGLATIAGPKRTKRLKSSSV